MASDYAPPALSTPDSSTERTDSSTSKRRRRSTVRVACNACRTKKTRCDGRRPVCGWCASRPGVHCVYDTESAEETRSAALKRENKILKRNLERAERLLQDLTSSSDKQSMELLKLLRLMGNPAGGSFSTTAYGYAEPFGSVENNSPNGTLPSIPPISDGVGIGIQSRLNHKSAAPMDRPSSNDVRNGQSTEFGYGGPGLSLLIKRSPPEPIRLSGGVQRAAHGSLIDTL